MNAEGQAEYEKLFEEGRQLFDSGLYEQSASSFEKAAGLGHFESAIQLAKMSISGKGIRPSPDTAETWIRRAAEILVSEKDTAVYTIGYALKTVESFTRILKNNGINALLDVRTTPYSKAYPDFNEDRLKQSLESEWIAYFPFKNQFGARRSEDGAYDDIQYYDGNKISYVNFEKTYRLRQFQLGAIETLEYIWRGYTVCFMCSEVEPQNCHRCIMVSNYFQKMGMTAKHLVSECVIYEKADVDRCVEECFKESYANYCKVSGKKEGVDNHWFYEESEWDRFFKTYTPEKGYYLRNVEIGYRR